MQGLMCKTVCPICACRCWCVRVCLKLVSGRWRGPCALVVFSDLFTVLRRSPLDFGSDSRNAMAPVHILSLVAARRPLLRLLCVSNLLWWANRQGQSTLWQTTCFTAADGEDVTAIQPNHRKVELVCSHCHTWTFSHKSECRECGVPLATCYTLLPQQWPPLAVPQQSWANSNPIAQVTKSRRTTP